MSGLKVVDPTTFTVTLSSPFAQFPAVVGYNPFYPLPKAFFDDPKAFGTRPIGNGPFQAKEDFVPGKGITLTRYDNYGGGEKGPGGARGEPRPAGGGHRHPGAP